MSPIASWVRRSNWRQESSRLDGSITPPLCGCGERRSATLVTATEAAVMVSQATTHAKEPPLKAMKMMQKALASQQEQRTTAHVRADLAAGRPGAKDRTPARCPAHQGHPPACPAAGCWIPQWRRNWMLSRGTPSVIIASWRLTSPSRRDAASSGPARWRDGRRGARLQLERADASAPDAGPGVLSRRLTRAHSPERCANAAGLSVGVR